MKRHPLKIIVLMMVIMMVSCNEPETIVTCIIHPDGTITRKIEMRSSESKFELMRLKVPFDLSWNIKDTMEISSKGDTTYIRTAEKLFKGTEGINLLYQADTGVNKTAKRSAALNRKFMWFNTSFRYSENIESALEKGTPLSDYLDKEQLNFFYSPESLKEIMRKGPDSLKYRAIEDSIEARADSWIIKNFVSEWISEFASMAAKKQGEGINENTLMDSEAQYVRIIEDNVEKFDSLWNNRILLKKLIGEEKADIYWNEADSAMKTVTERVFFDFKDYTVRIIMPGRLTGTNGFIDSSHVLLWPVKSDFFTTDSYSMWAESKITNVWAWIVTAAFLLFVLTGLILRSVRKH
jgi:hypothetical protein